MVWPSGMRLQIIIFACARALTLKCLIYPRLLTLRRSPLSVLYILTPKCLIQSLRALRWAELWRRGLRYLLALNTFQRCCIVFVGRVFAGSTRLFAGVFARVSICGSVCTGEPFFAGSFARGCRALSRGIARTIAGTISRTIRPLQGLLKG